MGPFTDKRWSGRALPATIAVMLRRGLLLGCVIALAGCSSSASSSKPKPPPVEVGAPLDLQGHVDPMISTGGDGFGIGSGYPGPALPYAMVHPGPDTRPSKGTGSSVFHCSGYYYRDTRIAGFSMLRMHGTGEPDYGVIGLMPVDGMNDSRRDEEGYAAGFSHKDEQASPGYYSVKLSTGIQVEITSTLRAALFRFTFPAGADPVVLLDFQHTLPGGKSGGGSVTFTGADTVAGWMKNIGGMSSRFGGFKVYADAVFDQTPSESGVWDDSGLHAGQQTATGTDLGAWLRFPSGTHTVQARVGISFVDAQGASGNLKAEIPAFDFDGVKKKAEAAWHDVFSRIEVDPVKGSDADGTEATILGTALYHSQLMPTLMSDVDGRAMGVQGNIVTSKTPRYSDFSLWDTYRTLHPWLLFTEDPHNQAFADSLLSMAAEGGALPRWPLANGDTGSMIGSPGEIVMAESIAKGVKPAVGEQKAYELSRVDAFGPSPGKMGGRGSITDYLKYGYVPADKTSGSVSRTLEYASADYAMAAWAKALGKSADASALSKHAESWKTLYDPKVGFFHGKNSDGSFDPWPGETGGGGDYTEGDAWQYMWLVPQDPEGLAATLGGTKKAIEKLDEFFKLSENETPLIGRRKYYWHGNEPDLIAAWLYAAWGDPARTVKWVDWIVHTFYGTGADGLAGNDDSGTLSAWLLFASTGLYPVAGTDRYIVAAPRYPRVVLHRPSGDLELTTTADPRKYPTVVSVTLDGKAVKGAYLTHAQLVGAHKLVFTMGAN